MKCAVLPRLMTLFAIIASITFGLPSVAVAATGAISSNSPCTLTGSSHCTVKINVTGQNANWLCVWASPTELFACGGGTNGYSSNWSWVNLVPRTMTLKAHATQPTSSSDYASGQTLATTVVVANPEAPVVSISSSTIAGLTAPAAVSFSASAVAGSGATISKVEYFNGSSSTPFATSMSGPTYSYTWTNLVAGTYSVRARATEILPDGRSFVSTDSNEIGFSVGADAQSGVCVATTAASFHTCAANMRAGSIGKIMVRGMIDCTSSLSGKDKAINPCGFVLDSIYAPVGSRLEVAGDPMMRSGFIRNDSTATAFNQPVLFLSNVHGLDLRDLVFNDGVSAVTDVHSGTMELFDSSDVVVSGNEFSNSKFSSIAMRRNLGVKIESNEFNDVQVFAIWSAGETAEISSNVDIANNYFRRTYSNAIIASFVDSRIVRNVFVGNHHVPLFGVSGGQLLVGGNSRNVLVGCNTVGDSGIPGYPNAVGIELAPTNLSDIRIVGNVIYNHDGYGISVNYYNVDVAGVVIRGNSLASNGKSPRSSGHPRSLAGQIDFDFPYFVPELQNNCVDMSCLESCAP